MVPTIEVDEATGEKVRLLAAAWATTEGQAISTLLDRMSNTALESCAETDASGLIPVHAIYDGTRVNATYNARNRSMTILDGPLVGQSFKSPSGAAVALIQRLNSKVNPNRNGWTFWWTEDGETLQTLRRQ